MPLYASGSFVPQFIKPKGVPDIEAGGVSNNKNEQIAQHPPVQPGGADKSGDPGKRGIEKNEAQKGEQVEQHRPGMEVNISLLSNENIFFFMGIPPFF